MPSAVMRNLRSYPALAQIADDWEHGLPERVRHLSESWELTVNGNLVGGAWSVLLGCRTASGADAVLKLCADDARVAAERAALTAWAGGPAVRVLAHARGALLLERLRPGSRVEELSVEDLGGLLCELDRPAVGVRGLRDYRVHAVERSVSRVRLLADTAGVPEAHQRVSEIASRVLTGCRRRPQVVCHGDLHSGNVLDGGRATVIDPYGIAAPRELDVAVGAANYGPAEDVRDRIAAVAELTGADTALALDFGRLYALLEAVHHSALNTPHASRSPALMRFALRD